MRTSHHKAKKSMLGVKKSSQTMKKTRKKECPLGEMRTKSGCKNAQDRLEALLRQLSPSTNIVWRRNAGRVAATKGKPKSAKQYDGGWEEVVRYEEVVRTTPFEHGAPSHRTITAAAASLLLTSRV